MNASSKAFLAKTGVAALFFVAAASLSTQAKATLDDLGCVPTLRQLRTLSGEMADRFVDPKGSRDALSAFKGDLKQFQAAKDTIRFYAGVTDDVLESLCDDPDVRRSYAAISHAALEEARKNGLPIPQFK